MAKASKATAPTSSSTARKNDRTSAYARDVVEGRIVAGPHVRNSCQRHLLDLKTGRKRGLWFDAEEAEKAFRYFETVLRLSEGQFEGRPFKLEPSQAFIVGSLFGWKRKNGTRRYRRGFIEMGKGNGKSPVAAGIGLKGLASDNEAGAQIYAAAAKRDQAGVLFADAVKMVRKSPALAKRLAFSGGPGREFNIAHHASASFFRCVSRDAGRTGSGPRPYFVLCDEVHEMPDRKILETLERGFKFRRQPLLLMITNSGSDRNSVAWEEHVHAINVAAGHIEAVNDPTFVGEPIDDATFSYVCALDGLRVLPDGTEIPADDPLNDPTCWIKANPLLGVTLSEEYLADLVHRAKMIPGQLNGILRLHFCVWTDAATAWMTRAALEPRLADFDIAIHQKKKLYVGLDLSQNRDITAAGFTVETGTTTQMVEGKAFEKPTYDAWIEAWTPGDTLEARELRDKIPYALWKKKGHIHAPPGESINYIHVAQRLVEYSRDYDIQVVAYDRYAFARFEQAMSELGVKLEYAEHPQGGLKKGKPTEAMKKAAEAAKKEPDGLWMPGSVKHFEEALLEDRLRLLRNPVLVSAILSAVTESDKWGNHWLTKVRSINKIDAAVALIMSLGAAVAMPKATKNYQVFFV